MPWRNPSPVVLGLAPLTGPAGALLGILLDSDPSPPLATLAGAEVTLVLPAGFLSPTPVWVRTEDAAKAAGFLGSGPVVLDAAWDPFTPRLGTVPGRLDGVEGALVWVLVFAPPPTAEGTVVVVGFNLSESFGSTSASAMAGVSLPSWPAGGDAAVSWTSSSGDAADPFSSAGTAATWEEVSSAPTKASMGSVVSMVTPSGFIPS